MSTLPRTENRFRYCPARPSFITSGQELYGVRTTGSPSARGAPLLFLDYGKDRMRIVEAVCKPSAARSGEDGVLLSI